MQATTERTADPRNGSDWCENCQAWRFWDAQRCATCHVEQSASVVQIDGPRVVIMQPTRGIARYMVFLPDEAGAREVGFVTHRTTGAWDFQRRDKTTCRIAYDRRRDAVAALIGEFMSAAAPVPEDPR